MEVFYPSPVATAFATSSLVAPSTPTATSTSPAPAVGQPNPTDRIALSPLASALHDESLTAFNALPTELRGQLASLVERGTLSGDDLHNALKHRLKEARSAAYWGTFRMTTNDNPDLAFQPTTTVDDYRNALQATSQRRAGLMDKLTALEAAGQGNSSEYTEVSRTLGAEMNPLPVRDIGRVGNPFSDFNFQEGRLMHTEAEMAAAHKLKDTGIDLMAIDRALRPIGEGDAASLINERIGRPGPATVARDGEFSIDTAFIKGFPTTGPTSITQTQKYSDAIDITTGATVTTQTSKLYLPKIDTNSLPQITPEETQKLRSYYTSVQARYP